MYSREIKGKTYYFYANTTNGKRREFSLGVDVVSAQRKLDILLKDTDAEWDAELVRLFGRTKKRAESRGIRFSISINDVREMFRNSGGKCSISGVKYSMEKVDGKRFRPWVPSIDRKHNDGPYSIENCRLVCAYINIAINQFGEDLLVTMARRIERNRRRLQASCGKPFPQPSAICCK